MLFLRLFGVLSKAPSLILWLLLMAASSSWWPVPSALAQTGCDVVDVCVKQLASDDPAVRTAAAYALGNIGDPKAVQELVKLIDREEDTEVQRTAVRSLGLIGDPPSAEALGRIMKAQPHLRDDVIQSLIRIGGKPASDALVVALDDSRTRRAAIQGLGEVGDRSAREPLLSLYRKTDDERVRGMASIAIQRIRSRLGPTAEEMGVPIYPGSRYFPNVLAEWIFTTDDPVEKVEGFYRNALDKSPIDFPTFKEKHEKTFQSTVEITEGGPSDPPDSIFIVEMQDFEGTGYPSKMIFLKRLPKKTRIHVYEAAGG